MKVNLRYLLVASVLALASLAATPMFHRGTQPTIAPVLQADGSDPMPLCRPHQGGPVCLPPAAVTTVAADIQKFKPNTQMSCGKPDANGCRTCRNANSGPVWVCPAVQAPKLEADGSDPMPLCRHGKDMNGHACTGVSTLTPSDLDMVLIADGSDPMPLCRARRCK